MFYWRRTLTGAPNIFSVTHDTSKVVFAAAAATPISGEPQPPQTLNSATGAFLNPFPPHIVGLPLRMGQALKRAAGRVRTPAAAPPAPAKSAEPHRPANTGNFSGTFQD